MTVDMLLDWDLQTISIYVDGIGIKAVPFFTKRATKLSAVNAVAIYGLTPESISRFRNLKICNELCDTEGKWKFLMFLMSYYSCMFRRKA